MFYDGTGAMTSVSNGEVHGTAQFNFFQTNILCDWKTALCDCVVQIYVLSMNRVNAVRINDFGVFWQLE